MLQPHDITTSLDQLRKNLVLVLQASPLVIGEKNETAAKVISRLVELGEINHGAAATNSLADLMPAATRAASVLPEPLCGLVCCVAKLETHLPWYQRPIDNNPSFMEGHSNAQIIGPQGLVIRHDLMVGVTLMRPGLGYPDHQHEPEEVYIVLSEGNWRQGKSPWHTPGLGGLVYNRSNVFHGMKSLNTPLIALWCLPLDKPFTSFSSPLPTTSS